ncbi:SPOR domain-containing protein [Thiosulfatihalobacter marinus]|uniref:SPOR domain-containing protein n=1 Tax=Thiosulfatihalobacter marinus TaxID=2792481 RepID=UPI0018D704FA|nr:SPOR domain-containing protein [Thiosulfatihalobacter marinus]
MAEIPLGMRGADAAPTQNTGKVVTWAGAVLSLALVAGTGVWGYKLLVRDVSGVPVVRALEGPMRKKPDNPGGEPAENQGLAVNKVAADGSAEKPADRLVLAPPPIQLSERDAVVEATRAPVLETEKLEKPAPRSKPDAIKAPPALKSGEALTVEELAAQLAAGAAPLSESGPADTPPVKTRVAALTPESEPAKASPKPVIKGGMKRSLRPVPRPATLAAPQAEQVQLASATPAIEAAPKAVDAADIPVGTRMVQLGAFASPEIAAAEWDKLSTRFSDYLGEKTRVIQKASSGGKVFYRLRAMGFADVSDARRLCSALKAENADCIPVTTR